MTGINTNRARSGASAWIERRGILLFAVAWAVYALAASLWLHIAPGGEPAFHLDLRVFRAGAQALLNGVPLYAEPLPVGGGREMPFTYPPVAAVLFIPLTWASPEAAGIVWTFFGYLALAGTLVCVSRGAARSRRGELLFGLIAMCFATALIPVWTALNLGQVGIILMLLVVFDMLAPRSVLPRGVLVGIAAAVKLTPAGFILFPLLRRDWRTAIWMTATAVAMTILGAIISWSDSVVYWSTLGQATDRVTVFAGSPNISLAGVLGRVTPEALRFAVLAVAVTATVAIGIGAMRRQFAAADPWSALMVNAVVILLVSPVSWDHHWVWAAPILLLLGLASMSAPARIGPLFVVTALIFLVEPGIPASWMRWVAWGLMYCVLLLAILPGAMREVPTFAGIKTPASPGRIVRGD